MRRASHERSVDRAARALAATALAAAGFLAVGTLDSPPARADAVAVTTASSPIFAVDAPDPDVVRNGTTYYAFTTGTTWGNHLGVLKDTSGNPASGWGYPNNGLPYANSALPVVPSWEQMNTQTSPGVFFYDGQWMMYYDASTAGSAADTGHNCLARATAATLASPVPVFTDTSTSPFFCQDAYGGAVDPSPFVDPATGQAWLLWKSNDGGSAQPARIWSAQLNSDGTGFVTQPVQILYNDTVHFPWEATVEDPSMVRANGTYYLLFAGGIWNSTSYDQGYAVCDGPQGPCSQPDANPVLSSYGSVAGPGGGSLFSDGSGRWWIVYAAWASGCVGYGTCNGTAARQPYVAPISLPTQAGPGPGAGNGPPMVAMARSGDGKGYWMADADGSVFSFGDAGFFGSMAGKGLVQPIVGMAPTADGQGYWLVASDGGIFAFGDAAFHGSMGGKPLNQPIVGMAPTAAGQGYWMDASDGGIFAFGDAAFHGSMGGKPLNSAVVGMAPTPSGRGYWLDASDGGIFAFGDAAFQGSMGGIPLNRPVVGMAVACHNGGVCGYWLVASDGGIFAFGAPFWGSAGSLTLARPVVAMAATPDDRGYWLVAADGGLFAYGDAGFYGSEAGKQI